MKILDIMKALTNLLIANIILTFLFGCEKENLNNNDDNNAPDKNALRIAKIADNSAMQDPWWTFKYNEDGLVTEIEGEKMWGKAIITYNDDELPVKIVWKEETYDISWTESSFTISYYYGLELQHETYRLDANGHIISIDDDFEARRNGNNIDIYYLDDGDEEWAQTRELNEFSHPLSEINIAILNACSISWVFDECDYTFQNDYCLAMNSSIDEGSAEYEYEYNEKGYPAELLINEIEGRNYKFYFEYETN